MSNPSKPIRCVWFCSGVIVALKSQVSLDKANGFDAIVHPKTGPKLHQILQTYQINLYHLVIQHSCVKSQLLMETVIISMAIFNFYFEPKGNIVNFHNVQPKHHQRLQSPAVVPPQTSARRCLSRCRRRRVMAPPPRSIPRWRSSSRSWGSSTWEALRR